MPAGRRRAQSTTPGPTASGHLPRWQADPVTSTRAGGRGRRLSTVPQASTTVLLPHDVFSPVRSVLRRLAASLVVLVLVATVVYVDRAGYRDAGGGSLSPLDALYYATVTLSTTGYGDIVPASGQARITNVLLVTPLRILFLIILVGTTLEVLTERTREQLRQSRWRTTLHDHTVVVGYGTKGRSAVRALLEDGLDPARVVVVDPDPAHTATATADGLAAVQGDGTRTEVLGQAGIARASKVVVAVPRDDTAVLVTLTVRAANREAHLVAGVREAENSPLLRHSGADEVVVSSEAAGRLLGVASASPPTGSVLTDLLEPGRGLELATRAVRASEVGSRTKDCPERVLAVVRDGTTVPFTSPDADPLRQGDLLVMVKGHDQEPPPG